MSERNQVQLIGNVGGNEEQNVPSHRTFEQKDGKKGVSFSLAINNGYMGKDENGANKWIEQGTDWYRITRFGATQDEIDNLVKGARVMVKGFLRKSKPYEEKDGTKHPETIEIVANNVYFLTKKVSTSENGSKVTTNEITRFEAPQPEQQSKKGNQEENMEPVEDLPF